MKDILPTGPDRETLTVELGHVYDELGKEALAELLAIAPVDVLCWRRT